MQRRIVKDEQAVSPVIAVILMVAITVVLAAVLYVWASSFLGGTTKNAPTGSMIASEDGSGVWTVQIVKINPQVSVNSVHWYLLDVQGNTKTDGLVSDVYGYYSGQGKAVVFIDNDFNGKLSSGDTFEVHPGEADSDLEDVGDVSDFTFRIKLFSENVTSDNSNEDTELGNDEEVTETEEDEETDYTMVIAGAGGLIAASIIGAAIIIRRD